jgi:hypothetical protein
MFKATDARRAAVTLGLLLSVSYWVPLVTAQGSPQGRYAVSLVKPTSWYYYMDKMLYTHNGDSRLYGPQHDLARDNVALLFTQYGLKVSLHPFLWSGNTYYNVIGERTGTVRPTQIYIVGGHYDSVNCPGADDNASAVATLLEIARLLGSWESEATIRLISFDREEQGLIGSRAYVNDYGSDDVRGMISLDMIAYAGPDPDKARLRGRPSSDPLKAVVAQAVRDYAGLAPTVEGALDRSDHAPFEWRGYQALWLAEYNYIERNPHYHKITDSLDTPGYISADYGAKITRAVLGWLVDAAGVQPDRPLGDLNCDWVVNNFDIDPFTLALTDPAGYKQRYPDCDIMLGDINGDGQVNNFDIDPFVVCLLGGNC